MKRHHLSRNASSAFTLIELLVVIAIIAILAAILFPVFAKVREKARQTACLSNMKQIGLGVAQYYQDFDETPPNGAYNYAPVTGWAGELYPYVKSDKVFRCPNELKVVQATDKAPSYGMNNNFAVAATSPATTGNPSAGLPNVVYPISKLTAPALSVLLFEVQGSTGVDVTYPLEANQLKNYNGSPSGNGSVGTYSPNGGGAFNSACGSQSPTETLKYATGWMGNRNGGTTQYCHFTDQFGRHSDGSNFLMADAHAKWLRGAQVSSGPNNPNSLSTYNQGNYAAGTEGNFSNGLKPQATFSIF